MDYLAAAEAFGTLRQCSQNFIVEACQKLHFTYTEYALLISLFEMEGASQDELTEKMGLDKSAVTRTVKSLETKGFIFRQQDILDKRKKHLYLTQAAKDKRKFLEQVIKSWVSYLTAGLSASQEEVLLQGFQQLAARALQADFRQLCRQAEAGDLT